MNEIISRNQLSIPELFEKYQDLISDTRTKLFSGLGYELGKDGLLFYKPYFSSADTISQQLIDEKVHQAEEIIKNLSSIKEEIWTLSELNNEQKEVLLGLIHRQIQWLQYNAHAIYIEAEKAWLQLSSEEIELHNREKLLLEDEMYGDRITDIPYRCENVAKKLHQLFDDKKEGALTEEEKGFWEQSIMSKLQPYTETQTDSTKKEATEKEESKEKISDTLSAKNSFIKEESLFPLINLLLETEWMDSDNIINLQVAENITEAFEENGIYYVPNTWKDGEIEDYFNKKGLGQKFKVIKLITGNASVSIEKWEGKSFKHNHVKFPPAKNGKYNLDRVLSVLFDHETETHIKTWLGNFNNYNLKTSGSSDFEEGVALLNQHLTTNISLDNFYDASIGDICQLLWETCDDQELKKALDILYKLNPSFTLSPDERFRRVRIWVPMGQKWTRRSDMTYGTGRDIIKKLEEMSKSDEGREKIKTYAKAKYGTQLAFDDVGQIDQILENIWSLNDMNVEFPVFAGKILYRKLFKGKLNKEEMLANDIRSLVAEPNVSYKQKRLLVQMYGIIKRDLKEQEEMKTESEKK